MPQTAAVIAPLQRRRRAATAMSAATPAATITRSANHQER